MGSSILSSVNIWFVNIVHGPDLGHDDGQSSVRGGDAWCGAGGRGDLHNAAAKIIKLNGATEHTIPAF